MKTFLLASLMGAGVAYAGTAGTNFVVTDPADWADADTALFYIERDLDESGHVIEYGIVEDAGAVGVDFFATSRDNGAGGTQTSIFRYEGGWFWRLWRNDDAGDMAWHVVGYDNGQVIVLQTTSTFVFGACVEGLVLGTDGTDGAKLYALPDNFNESWDVGLTEYTAAQVDVDEARARQEACGG